VAESTILNKSKRAANGNYTDPALLPQHMVLEQGWPTKTALDASSRISNNKLAGSCCMNAHHPRHVVAEEG
jgi:hypothetical protein